MNIREWFGYKGDNIFGTESDKCLDNLFSLYAKALEGYFSVNNTSDYSTFLHTVKNKKLTKSQELFLQWLEEKGIQQLLEFANKSVPSDEDLIATLEYEIYMLECEMDFDYPDDVVSSIMSITSLLPDIINPILESAAAAYDCIAAGYISSELDITVPQWEPIYTPDHMYIGYNDYDSDGYWHMLDNFYSTRVDEVSYYMSANGSFCLEENSVYLNQDFGGSAYKADSFF